MLLRNAQSFHMGLSRAAAATSGTSSGTLYVDSLLQDLQVINTASYTLISSIKVAGQEVLTTDSDIDGLMFHPQAQCEGQRSLGIPLAENQTVSFTWTSGASAIVFGSVGTDPILPDQVVPINALGSALDYAGGLGSASIDVSADTTTTLSATSRRDQVVGRMVFSASAVEVSHEISSIKVNNIEMLSGDDAIPLQSLGYQSTDYDGNVLAYPADTNTNITVAIENLTGAAGTDSVVKGGFFCMPKLAA
jgi:hypothetical protein